MRRRITEAIVGVAGLILLLLGIPLAIAVHQSILDSEVVELQATAARTLAEISLPLDPAGLAALNSETDAPPPFSIYDDTGRLVFGDGPAVADRAVTRALAGNPASTTDGIIVVATPITDDTSEAVVGAARLTESMAGTNHRSRIAWAIMGVAGLVALSVGWVVATRVARRLTSPVSELAELAGRIGYGGVVGPTVPSGIQEIDTLSDALATSAQRVTDSLARERRFTADVSHQLRTPLTGIRLRLEAVDESDPNHGTVRLALDDLHRLEETLDHLLDFARDTMPVTSTVRLDRSAIDCARRWRTQVDALGRLLTVDAPTPTTARGSDVSVAQILDVLVDNCIRHGHGTIAVTMRRIVGGAAIDVADQGAAIAPSEIERIFERGHGDHHGIGLALARALAEADGGRLLLTRRDPTTFSLLLLDPT